MVNLLKADLLRIVKDKLFIILAIISAALAVVIPLFVFALFKMLGMDNLTIRESMSSIGIATLFMSPFSNVGLVMAIFMIIIITKDFSNGTVRNKLIMGKTRREVFISNLLSSLITMLGLILGFVLISFMVSCIFFNSGFGQANTGDLLLRFGLSVLGWITLITAINFFAMNMKNAGLAIVIYVVIGLVLTFASTIITTVCSALQSYDEIAIMQGLEPSYTKAINVLSTIDAFNFVGAMSNTLSSMTQVIAGLGAGEELKGSFIAEYCSSAVVFGALFSVGGYFIFRKKDLK